MAVENSGTASPPAAQPLDAFATALIIMIAVSWGFNQVSAKLAINDIPPLIQSAVRSASGALLVGIWMRARGMPIMARDGTLWAGIIVGILFAVEFLLIYRGLVWTTASRGVVFVYLAPFFVALGSPWFMPSDRLGALQWTGLVLSFAGVAVAFGIPGPTTDPYQIVGDLMMIGGAIAWAATTLLIKATSLQYVSSEKTTLYQVAVSAPMLAVCAFLFGERVAHTPSAVALGALAYQAVWVVSITYVIWFGMIVRYSANRLSVFTFLTPVFGVAAGHVVLGEPLTPSFAIAAVLVAAGLVLVNRPR